MTNQPDVLVPRAQVARELGKSSRTIIRYENAKRAGFDRPVTISGRVHHLRSRIDAVKLLGDRFEGEVAE